MFLNISKKNTICMAKKEKKLKISTFGKKWAGQEHVL